jgi:hypothetical protein
LAIQVSNTNGTSPSDWTTIFSGEIPAGTGANPTMATSTFMLEDVSAQFVAFINTGFGNRENWSDGAFTNDAGFSEVRFYGTGTLIPGDVNGDLMVDEDDYAIIRMNMFTEVSSRGEGDLVFDGLVDFRDFKEWKSHASGAVLAAVFGNRVPEPGTFFLLSVVALLIGATQRLRRA